jgi:hypothetical protein
MAKAKNLERLNVIWPPPSFYDAGYIWFIEQSLEKQAELLKNFSDKPSEPNSEEQPK